MTGKTLSHYRLVEQIGAGGMGVVYRAHDERLERDVALKVLPADTLADEETRKRFRKEALALSQLNHPNIATVFDFDSQDGVDFLVMEIVAGELLAAKLTRGALPEKEVAALGGQIAAALEEAHERGIVHRDLKPGNVMVTPKGQAKVLDFGLAKLKRRDDAPDATASATETKGIAGTLPYMAPEQLRNEVLDARTDIHALGAVLYEMATGKRVFVEDSSPRLTDAILHRLPVSARSLNARIAPELDRIILKCLEKEPENRYQAAKEVAVDLRRLASPPSATAFAPVRRATWSPSRVALTAGIVVVAIAATLVAFNVGGLRERLLGHAGPPRIESIAVLPLDNLSGDPAQEYFADGMTEALISNLAQIGALRVISRTSVMQYKGARKPLPQIAKELGVDAVIEGSVQRSGDRVKVTAQLIRTATDTHLWAKEYERDLRDVLTLQSEVARAIASEIKVQITPQEQTRLASARPVNPEALEAYLRGRYAWNKFTIEGFQQAIAYFEQAIRKDPLYALPYTGLADAEVQLAGRVMPATVAMPKAKEAALRALELDPNLAEGHNGLAFVTFYFEWNWSEAEKEYLRAIELNSGYSHVHGVYAHYLAARGQFEKALAEWGRAKEIDPLSNNCVETRLLSYARRFAQAIEVHRKMLERDPEAASSCFWVVTAYVKEGMADQAIAQAQKAAARLPGETLPMALQGHAYWAAGKKEEARALLTELLALSKKQYVSPYNVAVLYAGLGDRDRTMEWLEKAFQERAGLLVYLNVDPSFDNLRGDSRFKALTRRMNLPE